MSKPRESTIITYLLLLEKMYKLKNFNLDKMLQGVDKGIGTCLIYFNWIRKEENGSYTWIGVKPTRELVEMLHSRLAEGKRESMENSKKKKEAEMRARIEDKINLFSNDYPEKKDMSPIDELFSSFQDFVQKGNTVIEKLKEYETHIK